MKAPMRLQKYLASCGVASRRKAEELIRSGRVQVDGAFITQMGTTVIPGDCRVLVDGREVHPEKELVAYLLNKPKGYVTTLSDPQGRPVVTALLGKIKERVFPVGRLDFDTTGALLLTNDGALAQRVQHPSHGTNKTYEALVRGRPTAEAVARLTRGIKLEGKMTAPARLRYGKRVGNNQLMEITIHEGRKHQVKKMFGAIGHPVLELQRTAYGRLRLGGLEKGQWKRLNSADLKKIFL
jgi:pseudouridine synthase